jgi:hypothetical protein
MEVTVNIPFADLLTLIDRLSPAQKARIQSKLSDEQSATTSKERLRMLLLNGPNLTDEQLQTIHQTRKEINQWRAKS